jgi:hypothetical protein
LKIPTGGMEWSKKIVANAISKDSINYGHMFEATRAKDARELEKGIIRISN